MHWSPLYRNQISDLHGLAGYPYSMFGKTKQTSRSVRPCRKRDIHTDERQ